MTTKRSILQPLAGILLGVLLSAGGLAQHPSGEPAGAAPAADPYAPFERLIGEWDVSPEGQASAMVMRFKWGGTRRGYIFYSASLLLPGGKEDLHFEGLLIWNALDKNLDMLLTLDPVRGTTQERGKMFVEADGTIVREIEAIGPQSVRGPDGKPTAGSAHFRQTFKFRGADQVHTVVLRETKTGWVPTFPGSDNLLMTRRAPPPPVH